MFIKWLHHLFNPHCEHCRLDAKEERICQSCEMLKLELEAERFEKKQLLTYILTPPMQTGQPVPIEKPVAVRASHVPWETRRRMLEENDRVTAKLMQDKEVELRPKGVEVKPIEQLEKELGVVDNG